MHIHPWLATSFILLLSLLPASADTAPLLVDASSEVEFNRGTWEVMIAAPEIDILSIDLLQFETHTLVRFRVQDLAPGHRLHARVEAFYLHFIPADGDRRFVDVDHFVGERWYFSLTTLSDPPTIIDVKGTLDFDTDVIEIELPKGALDETAHSFSGGSFISFQYTNRPVGVEFQDLIGREDEVTHLYTYSDFPRK